MDTQADVTYRSENPAGASTTDEVIERLGAIIDRCYVDQSRLGLFPALYRRVTIAVRDGIASGRFEDGPRMERFDVIFANRYLEAFQRYKQNEFPGSCWNMSFEIAKQRRPLTLQHLLLGMNAHINLDLGIAAANTSPGDSLTSLKGDFDEINTLLLELVDDVQDRIAEISPLLGWIDHIGNRSDEALVNFSMIKARDAAWDFAQKLAPLEQEQQNVEIVCQDQQASCLGRLIRRPGITGSLLALAIRCRESNDVRKIMDALT